ncbi:MAG: ABC transporter substrate-binding protein [Acidimicrobiia bacterium]|nr:ABC transporter substrate-binding protein [Acidimicrobiia bacterium]
MNPKKLLIMWLAILALLAMAASACGNDDDAPATSEPEPTVATSEPEPEPEPTSEPEPEPTSEPEPEPTQREMQDVSLRLPWFPSAQFAGSYVAAAKGFFEEEGLNVTINPGGFDVNSITLVAAGSDDFGLHDTNSLLFAAVEEIPLVTVATYLHAHPGAIMSLESSGFESLSDLVGATIGFQEGGPWQLTQAMLTQNGVDPDSLNQVAVGFDLTPLFEGDIDLLTVFSTNEPVLAELQGFSVDVFIPYNYGVQTSANALFTTTSFRQDNPEVVCGMVRAMARGWQYAFDNPEEAVEIIVAVDPDNLTVEKESASLEAVRPSVLSESALADGIGTMTAERWQTVDEVLRQYGGLEADIDLANVYDDYCF